MLFFEQLEDRTTPSTFWADQLINHYTGYGTNHDIILAKLQIFGYAPGVYELRLFNGVPAEDVWVNYELEFDHVQNLDLTAFIQKQYHDFLGRTAADYEVQAWTFHNNRYLISHDIAHSFEAAGAHAGRTYLEALDRHIGVTEVHFWYGIPWRAADVQIYGSYEFEIAHTSMTDYFSVPKAMYEKYVDPIEQWYYNIGV